MHTTTCFKRLPYNYGKITASLEGIQNLVLGCTEWHWIPQFLYHRKSTRTVKTQDISNLIYKIESSNYDDTEELQLKALYKAIQQLNDIDKELIFLYLEDKPYKEIATTLGISNVNARVKMNRVKEKIKKALNP